MSRTIVFRAKMFRPVMASVLVACLLMALSSCSQFTQKHASPALPDQRGLACCWQSLEQLEIDSHNKKLTLSSAVAVEHNKLTLVVLDPLARRIFTITQQNNAIVIDKASGVTQELPINWLLIGFYLRHLPEKDWAFKGSDWQLQHQGDQTRLLESGQLRITMNTINDNVSSATNPTSETVLIYHHLDFKVKVTTLSKQLLSRPPL